MSLRLLLIPVCLWMVAARVTAHPQEQSRKEMIVVEGLTETAAGCPVVLSEARYQRPKIITPQDGLTEVVEQVKIENVSGSAIRKAYIMFRYVGPDGGMMGLSGMTKPIGVGETLLSKHPYRIGTAKTVEGYDGEFAAIAIAVEFEDNTHWVTPSRVDFPVVVQSLHAQRSPLAVRRCDDIDTGYRAVLMTNSDQVVAYRLGVVKDTPTSFGVRVGEWMPMPEASTPERAEIKISAADPRVSLPQSWLFKREKLRFDRLGRSITHVAGVALFVAEVRLSDGTIWKQDLTRDELMWGLYR